MTDTFYANITGQVNTFTSNLDGPQHDKRTKFLKMSLQKNHTSNKIT